MTIFLNRPCVEMGVLEEFPKCRSTSVRIMLVNYFKTLKSKCQTLDGNSKVNDIYCNILVPKCVNT